MRRLWTGDVWVDAKLLQAEERAAEARALTAHRALLRTARPTRRGVRVRLGSVLLALGHRLLASALDVGHPSLRGLALTRQAIRAPHAEERSYD